MTTKRRIKSNWDTQDNQEELVKALQMLFDLLEDYAPCWYSEEHHDTASAALAHSRKLQSNRRVAS